MIESLDFKSNTKRMTYQEFVQKKKKPSMLAHQIEINCYYAKSNMNVFRSALEAIVLSTDDTGDHDKEYQEYMRRGY